MKRAEIEEQIEQTIEASKAIDTVGEYHNKTNLIKSLTALFIQLSEERESKSLEACRNIVETYEFDGMEQMRPRDEAFYKTCKEAILNAPFPTLD